MKRQRRLISSAVCPFGFFVLSLSPFLVVSLSYCSSLSLSYVLSLYLFVVAKLTFSQPLSLFVYFGCSFVSDIRGQLCSLDRLCEKIVEKEG